METSSLDYMATWKLVSDSDAYKFIKDTKVYGGFMVWHLVLFMVLGPMLTWPMLILLLLVFSTQTVKLIKGVSEPPVVTPPVTKPPVVTKPPLVKPPINVFR